jgi:hypothetical protein
MKKRFSLLCLLVFAFLSSHVAAFADIIPFPPRPVHTAEPSAATQIFSTASPLPIETESTSIIPYLLIGLALIVLAVVIWRRNRLKK